MKFLIKKSNLYFYSMLVLFLFIIGFTQLNQTLKRGALSTVRGEKRVIKCELPLENNIIQNVYYVSESLQGAKQILFNSKNGLFFDNALYIKTTDFNGENHVVAFKDIHCDSVGTQVSLK